MNDFYQLDAEGQAARMASLARAALAHWDIAAVAIDLIKYRENAVFRITDRAGVRYALRIHRAGYHSDAQLRSELQWMRALDQHGIAVPPVVPARDGVSFVVVSSEGVPEPRQVDIFGWVAGEQLGSVEAAGQLNAPVSDTYRTIGTLAAQLHNQAVSWELPEGFERHRWDAPGLAGEEPLWGRFWELAALSPAQRATVLTARERVFEGLQRYAAAPENAMCYSLIHADFVAENLLVQGSDVRLIDFDDSGFGWHLFEIATALFFEKDEPHYPQALEALVAGYREYRDLPASQLAQLPLFYAARSFTYLGWVHTRSETETARQMTPMLIDKALRVIEEYG
ncbi:aminoglycoside phosphotransferase [Kineobactrum sediminis]|uniref:Aminoglycoside phosphotransferase n=1 Tax=Kineobactrum sediminis TaxID=1905677 RepID=A0A2N5Y5K3_9GAMM|nr:phosphotransferase [Kineobactrum sediminis]PLW83652.1 aminoglycoside phosphotransferase [Kineobactrum sediminis]